MVVKKALVALLATVFIILGLICLMYSVYTLNRSSQALTKGQVEQVKQLIHQSQQETKSASSAAQVAPKPTPTFRPAPGFRADINPNTGRPYPTAKPASPSPLTSK